jgi:hypothetical protein
MALQYEGEQIGKMDMSHEDVGREAPGSGRLAVAAILILISGAFMVWAGFAFAEGRVAFGLWITTPPGFTIEAAFLFVRRHDRSMGRPGPSLRMRLGQEGIIGLAGGVMVLAGYVGAVWSWIAASPLILVGLPVIGSAVWLGRRSLPAPAVRAHAASA